jgi:hypothetical protein
MYQSKTQRKYSIITRHFHLHLSNYRIFSSFRLRINTPPSVIMGFSQTARYFFASRQNQFYDGILDNLIVSLSSSPDQALSLSPTLRNHDQPDY